VAAVARRIFSEPKLYVGGLGVPLPQPSYRLVHSRQPVRWPLARAASKSRFCRYNRATATSGYGLIVTGEHTGVDGNTYINIVFQVADGGVLVASDAGSFPAADIPARRWSHVACSFSTENGVSLYINGAVADRRPSQGGRLLPIGYVYNNRFRVGA
jgi:hypothetical protein